MASASSDLVVPTSAFHCIVPVSPVVPTSDSASNRLVPFTASSLSPPSYLPYRRPAVTLSPQRKGHGDCHRDLHRRSVEQRRREAPLADGVERRLIERRLRTQHDRIRHATVLADGGFDDHAPFDS